MTARPLAVKIYCGVIAALFVTALALITVPFLMSEPQQLTDVALMFVPLLVLLIFVWGVWQVRWWGVIGLSIIVIAVEGWMISAMPEQQSVTALIRGALWLVPLWWIAWAHRRLFR